MRSRRDGKRRDFLGGSRSQNGWKKFEGESKGITTGVQESKRSLLMHLKSREGRSDFPESRSYANAFFRSTNRV